MPSPIEYVNKYPLGELEEKVNLAWRAERNLNRDFPTPTRYHHIQEAKNLLPWADFPNPVHIVKGKYIFSKTGDRLYCHFYSPPESLECVWCSEALPLLSDFGTRSCCYFEDGREVLVITNFE